MPVVCGELVSTIVCVILGTIQYQDSIPLLVAIASREEIKSRVKAELKSRAKAELVNRWQANISYNNME